MKSKKHKFLLGSFLIIFISYIIFNIYSVEIYDFLVNNFINIPESENELEKYFEQSN